MMQYPPFIMTLSLVRVIIITSPFSIRAWAGSECRAAVLIVRIWANNPGFMVCCMTLIQIGNGEAADRVRSASFPRS